MATDPDAVRTMVLQLIKELKEAEYEEDGDLDLAFYGKATSYIQRGLGTSSHHLREVANIRSMRFAGVIDEDHFRREFETRKRKLLSLLSVVAEDLQFEAQQRQPALPNRSSAEVQQPTKLETPSPAQSRSGNAAGNSGNRVFVVHGHDDGLLHEVELMLRRHGLDPLIVKTESDRGNTLIEKIEAGAAQASYAIVLLSPDDLGASRRNVARFLGAGRKGVSEHLEPRARQNVLIEWGYLSGKLGRNRVCCILKAPTRLPSDLHGLAYKSINHSISEVAIELLRELRSAGLPVQL